MELIDYFPTKLAKFPRFCNRVKERELLTDNIYRGRHTVLISPRRYGKSSLVHHTVSETKISAASIDLFLAHDGKAITKRILTGVGEAIAQIIPFSQRALDTVQHFFSTFKIVVAAGGFGLQLAHEAAGFDPVDQIFDSLKSLAKLAESRKKKILLFLDEFQDITSAENSKAIQGAIRHVAQDTANLVFIFSGSSRHLLLQLFDDKSKPLYMLCDKIFLDRMSSADYESYIQEAAKAKWRRLLDPVVLDKILTLTELHPFYVNLLCHELWKNKKIPTIEDVTAAWIVCYEIEEERLIAELEKLTSNQQDILKALALIPIEEPNSQKFLHAARLSLSSVRGGIKALREKDMIFRVKKEDDKVPGFKKDQYRVLDPLLAYMLRKYS